MRYFLAISYLGTHYHGWQIQPNAQSVQGALETALQTILREKIEITGCGRTDTGVHSRFYIAHFNTEQPLPDRFLWAVNGILSADIAVHGVAPMHADAHARYDAFERSYQYHITVRKNPFLIDLAWQYTPAVRLEIGLLQETADLICQYKDFKPFCKTNSGVDHYHCEMKTARWEKNPSDGDLVFHITANRFLRGMVRLIVGACIQVGNGQLTLDQVRHALDTQTPLPRSLSAPPCGLFLTDVRYPYPVVF